MLRMALNTKPKHTSRLPRQRPFYTDSCFRQNSKHFETRPFGIVAMLSIATGILIQFRAGHTVALPAVTKALLLTACRNRTFTVKRIALRSNASAAVV